MKAAILEKQNSPLIVDEISVPNLSIGQVLVKVNASGICGRQIGEITGAKGEDKFLPHLLGHEGGGIVKDTGPGVRTVKKGDKVVMHWRKGVGIESDFPVYKWKNRTVGGGLVTTFSEYSVVSENRLTRVTDDIPSQIAALMGCATTTALGLVNNEAELKIGQSIAIIGTGSVGLNVIQAASMVSAYPIIAVDMYAEKLNLASELGATHYINTSETDLSEQIKNIVGSNGVDVIVECSGKTTLIETAYNLTSAGGRMIMVGQPHFRKDLLLRSMSKNFCGKKLIDSEGGQTNPTVDIPRYIKLYCNGKLHLDKIITNQYSLDNVNQAIDDIKSGNVLGKCMLIMD